MNLVEPQEHWRRWGNAWKKWKTDESLIIWQFLKMILDQLKSVLA